MSAQHTPGPWDVYGHSIMPSPDNRRPDTMLGVAEVLAFNGERRTSTVEANARLIAAAPEMLEALKEALGFLQDMNVIGDLPDTMRAAIAKAESGT